MAKSPFYTVVDKSSGTNITEYVTDIDYEDVIEGDDIITFTLKGLSMQKIDEDFLDTGRVWDFYYGFIGGVQSANRLGQITQSTIKYNKGKADVTVIARDLGYNTKRVNGSYVYKNKTASEIATDIASKFGLGTDIETTTKVYESVALGNKNFMQFLKDLALKEGSDIADSKGSIEVYVRGSILNFKRRDLSKEASRLYEYNNGSGKVMSLEVTYEDTGSTPTQSVTSSGVDTETGEIFTAKVSKEDNAEATTGNKDVTFSVDGVLQSPIIGTDAEGVTSAIEGQCITVPANNEADAKSKITNTQKDSVSKAMKLTIRTELDPTIEAGEMITVSGISQKHIGNWRIHKVRDTINGSGGITTITAYRNGAKKSGTVSDKDNTGDTNNTTGNTDEKVTKDLNVVTFNSQTGAKI